LVRRETVMHDGAVLLTRADSPLLRGLDLPFARLGGEGYLLRSATVRGKRVTIIAGNSDIGALYGVFRFLALVQAGQPIDRLDIVDAPKLQVRVLNHWDNLDRHVERGYAGQSIWDWQKLPLHKDPRYT
ncbi:alpha-glucuronidase, partial [Salmonella enterica subsp. enterica serovar Enteritidis]|nr:alpha-glucuronidase [Salmonella enterica subsp. enterica serovar Enteritidis]